MRSYLEEGQVKKEPEESVWSLLNYHISSENLPMVAIIKKQSSDRNYSRKLKKEE